MGIKKNVVSGCLQHCRLLFINIGEDMHLSGNFPADHINPFNPSCCSSCISFNLLILFKTNPVSKKHPVYPYYPFHQGLVLAVHPISYFCPVSYPSLTFTFLGTGTSSGVPMIGCECEVCQSSNKKDNRLRSSLLVQSPTTTIVIDAGPDFRYQMLRAKVKQLDAILFTHPHKDHVAGLDDVRAFNYLSGLPMQVYANEMTQDVLVREFPYAFAETRYPGVPEIKLNTISTNSFKIGDIEVLPIEVWHHRMPVLGFKFGGFTYITDANRIEPEERMKIAGGEILVLNVLRKEKHISHFTLEEAISVGKDLTNKENYFTHISHQLGKHDDVENELPETFFLAYDGLQLKL